MSSNTLPVFTIVGATGVQGRSTIAHFLAQSPPTYHLRGITRDPSSSKAAALISQGVEMVKADVNDQVSPEAAFSGSTAIFAYTDSDSLSHSPKAIEMVKSGQAKSVPEAAGQIEIRQGRNIANAGAKVPSLERLIWSTLDEPAEGSPLVYEIQAKNEGWNYIISLPELQGKASSVKFTMFADGFVRFSWVFGWTKKGEKKYALRMPISGSARIPWIDMPNDAGSWVEAVLRAPAGTKAIAVGEALTFNEVLEAVNKQYGIEAKVETVSLDEYAKGDGLMTQLVYLLQSVERYSTWKDNPDVLGADELAKKGFPVKRSSIQEAVLKLDWPSIL